MPDCFPKQPMETNHTRTSSVVHKATEQMQLLHRKRRNYSPLQEKLILQCNLCSGLVVGFPCFEHHREECSNLVHAIDRWKLENYRPLLQQDGKISFLGKWIDCNKCKRQQIMANFLPGTLTFKLKIINWARLTFLLQRRRKAMAAIKLSKLQLLSDHVLLMLVLQFIT